jgi:hypothetical protein
VVYPWLRAYVLGLLQITPKVHPMTRSEALHKLLALGPLSKGEIQRVTGWNVEDVQDTLVRLILNQMVTFKHENGSRHYMLVANKVNPTQFGKPRESRAFIAQQKQPLISAHNVFSVDFYPTGPLN